MINRIESKGINLAIKYRYWLLLLVVTMVAIKLRVDGYHYLSLDMGGVLLHWYDQIGQLGTKAALRTQVGDYNILYQNFIVVAVRLHIPALLAFKLFSQIFDFLIAGLVGYMVCVIRNQKSLASFVYGYAAVLLSPLVVLNSAYWGQADAIYSFFLMASLFLLYKNKNTWAFVFLGLALSFKLQAVLLIPVFILVYLVRKNFSILNFLFLPIVLYVFAIPNILLGRDAFSPIQNYINQTSSYHFMTLNTPNIWMLVGGNPYDVLSSFGVMLTFSILAFGIFFILNALLNDRVTLDFEFFLNITIWIMWTGVMFLPAMHERYGYIAEIFLSILCIYNFKKYFIPLILMFVPSLVVYSKYLFVQPDVYVLPNITTPIIYIIGYVYFTWLMFKEMQSTNSVE